MSKSRVELFFIVFLVFGLLAGQSAAKFGDCYKICLVTCMGSGKNIFACAAKCVKDCIIPKPQTSLDPLAGTHYFCKLGCASTLCTKLSTIEDPVELFFIVFLVFGLLAGQSAAKFGDCYKICLVTCLGSGKNILACAAKCVKDCIIPKPQTSLDPLAGTHYFCKLGCASTLCTKLSTIEDPAEEKVEGCVNSCSETCTKKY
ncbi:hypothetical protein ACOSQ3_020946 [Xanthoceras sorbifolium]